MKRQALIPRLTAGCAAAVLATAAAGAVRADPPSLVGRISAVDGDVAFLPPGDQDWGPATRNYPVTEGESFWTGDEGRTALQIGPIEARLDSQTELDVLRLDYGRTRFSLPQGSMDLRVWRAPRGGIQIATPAGDIRIDQPGLYRIDVGASPDDGGYPPVELTVFEGEAGAPSPEGFVAVDGGSAALIYAGYDPEYLDAQDAAIDDWGRAREARHPRDGMDPFADSMPGYDDLAAQGDFADTPDYGRVWFPRDAPPGWAPYRFGHWAYVQPWGYTWIDDQAWGFAPFHYGRWAQIQGRWGWIPGQPSAEPVYAPALVAFFGGGGWNVSFGAGGSAAAVGWAPLAPDEVYRPSYQVSPGYLRQVNVTNVRQTTINNITVINVAAPTQYRNAAAATVVRSDAFARGGAVQRSSVAVTAGLLSHAPAAQVASAQGPGGPALPPPVRQPPAARTGGGAARPGAGGGPVGAVSAPPARLQTLRAAVAAQTPGSSRPAPIAGVRITPPAPHPAGAPPALVGPAQLRNPAAQGRQAVTPPSRPAGQQAPRPFTPGAGTPPVAPLRPAATPPARPGFEPPAQPRVQPQAAPMTRLGAPAPMSAPTVAPPAPRPAPLARPVAPLPAERPAPPAPSMDQGRLQQPEAQQAQEAARRQAAAQAAAAAAAAAHHAAPPAPAPAASAPPRPADKPKPKGEPAPGHHEPPATDAAPRP